jgi:hypothetical protein
VRIAAELAAWMQGFGDELAIAEALAAIDRPGEPSRPDRALAAAIAHELRLGFAQPTSRGALGARTA